METNIITSTDGKATDAEFSKNTPGLIITKADDQKIGKTGSNMDNLDDNLQKQPDKIGRKQEDLEVRLKKLNDLNSTILGSWAMSKRDKALLEIDSKANQEALQIIRKGENNNLSAIADYQTRYLKAILHNLVLVGESNLVGAAKLHYENAKMVLHEKLLNKMEEMTLLLEGFENRASGRPEKFRKILIEAADRTLIQWSRDFDNHLDEFAELLKKTFSR